MEPIEVLKMLNDKIHEAGLRNCTYVIETSDEEAIALTLSSSYSSLCKDCDYKTELSEAIAHIKELYAQIRDMERKIKDLENQSDIGRYGYGE